MLDSDRISLDAENVTKAVETMRVCVFLFLFNLKPAQLLN